MVYDDVDHVGGARVAQRDQRVRVRDRGGAPRRDRARVVRKEPVSMRATQFIRRGLIAFAAVASLSLGLVGVASAQSSGTAGFTPDGDPVVLNPIPGYDYALVNTPGFGDTAIIGL